MSCPTCSKSLAGTPQVSAMGKIFHKTCFNCTNCSKNLLQLGTFAENEGKPYCPDCLQNLFAKKCDVCHQPKKSIINFTLPGGAKLFCTDCFSCHKCKVKFDSNDPKSYNFFRDGNFYCTPHFLEMLPQCKMCNKAIQDNMINAMNSAWHKDCFTCKTCKISVIGSNFYNVSGFPYCSKCAKLAQKNAAPKGDDSSKSPTGKSSNIKIEDPGPNECHTCKSPFLAGSSYFKLGINNKENTIKHIRYYHENCIKCNICSSEIGAKGQIFCIDGEVVCGDCQKEQVENSKTLWSGMVYFEGKKGWKRRFALLTRQAFKVFGIPTDSFIVSTKKQNLRAILPMETISKIEIVANPKPISGSGSSEAALFSSEFSILTNSRTIRIRVSSVSDAQEWVENLNAVYKQYLEIRIRDKKRASDAEKRRKLEQKAAQEKARLEKIKQMEEEAKQKALSEVEDSYNSDDSGDDSTSPKVQSSLRSLPKTASSSLHSRERTQTGSSRAQMLRQKTPGSSFSSSSSSSSLFNKSKKSSILSKDSLKPSTGKSVSTSTKSSQPSSTNSISSLSSLSASSSVDSLSFDLLTSSDTETPESLAASQAASQAASDALKMSRKKQKEEQKKKQQIALIISSWEQNKTELELFLDELSESMVDLLTASSDSKTRLNDSKNLDERFKREFPGLKDAIVQQEKRLESFSFQFKKADFRVATKFQKKLNNFTKKFTQMVQDEEEQALLAKKMRQEAEQARILALKTAQQKRDLEAKKLAEEAAQHAKQVEDELNLAYKDAKINFFDWATEFETQLVPIVKQQSLLQDIENRIETINELKLKLNQNGTPLFQHFSQVRSSCTEIGLTTTGYDKLSSLWTSLKKRLDSASDASISALKKSQKELEQAELAKQKRNESLHRLELAGEEDEIAKPASKTAALLPTQKSDVEESVQAQEQDQGDSENVLLASSGKWRAFQMPDKRIYFYNVKSGVSRWKKPKKFTAEVPGYIPPPSKQRKTEPDKQWIEQYNQCANEFETFLDDCHRHLKKLTQNTKLPAAERRDQCTNIAKMIPEKGNELLDILEDVQKLFDTHKLTNPAKVSVDDYIEKYDILTDETAVTLSNLITKAAQEEKEAAEKLKAAAKLAEQKAKALEKQQAAEAAKAAKLVEEEKLAKQAAKEAEAKKIALESASQADTSETSTSTVVTTSETESVPITRGKSKKKVDRRQKFLAKLNPSGDSGVLLSSAFSTTDLQGKLTQSKPSTPSSDTDADTTDTDTDSTKNLPLFPKLALPSESKRLSLAQGIGSASIFLSDEQEKALLVEFEKNPRDNTGFLYSEDFGSKLLGAKIECLIGFLTSNFPVSANSTQKKALESERKELTTLFLATFHGFLSTVQLFQLLAARFHQIESNSIDGLKVRRNIITMMIEWITIHPHEFLYPVNSTLFETLYEFLDDASEIIDEKEYASMISRARKSLIRRNQLHSEKTPDAKWISHFVSFITSSGSEIDTLLLMTAGHQRAHLRAQGIGVDRNPAQKTSLLGNMTARFGLTKRKPNVFMTQNISMVDFGLGGITSNIPAETYPRVANNSWCPKALEILPNQRTISVKHLRSGWSYLKKFTADQVAEEISISDHKLFREIRFRELLDQAWSDKKARLERAPNVCDMIKRFDSVAHWVVTEILSSQKLATRAKVLVFMIQVALKCKELNNWNAVMAIMAGLANSGINRLVITWEELDEQLKNDFEQLETLTASKGSWKIYRDILEKIPDDKPCVPFLGVYLTDLTFVDDGNPQYLGHSQTYINIDKLRMVYKILKKIRRFQQTGYSAPSETVQSKSSPKSFISLSKKAKPTKKKNSSENYLESNPKLAEYLLYRPITFDDEEHYQQSRVVEPPEELYFDTDDDEE